MPGIEQQQPTFQFGVFALEPRTGELRKHGVKLKLQDQPLQILTLLLEHAGEVVTREDIQKRLWSENTYVDFDNAINSAIRKLRDALSDSPDNPRFVETLARRGYRFIAPVSRVYDPLRESSSSVQSQTVTLPVSPPKPVAQKRRIWWMACALTAMLVAAGTGLRLWMVTRPDQASSDTPLPAVPLTGNPGYESFPTFSPEGTRVAFSWEQPGKQGPSIYVKLIGPGDPLRLTTNLAADFAPAWSPDGRYVAFLRAHGPSHAAIIIIPAVGGQERELAEITFEANENLGHWIFREVPPPFLAWSADGRWLLSLEKVLHETSAIIRVSVETGEKRTLTSPPMHTNGDGSLAVSPDGKMLAFTRTLGLFERDIYIVSLSEDMVPRGEPRRLTFDGKEMDGLSWTADGRNLVFSSKRGGRRELWQMPATPSGHPVRLSAADDDPLDVAIAREGRHLVYSHPVWDWDIWRLSLNGKRREEASRLISSTRLEHHSRYSPDGQRIAFQSNRSGNEEIWTCHADGSNPVQLTSFRNAHAGSPRWSPDGQKITFDGNAAGNWDIYVIPSQGGKPTRLTKSEINEFRPSWSHDGKWIYYCSTRTGHVQVWKIPASGGREVQVTTNGGGVAFESVEGEDLYYTKEDGLWKMPVRGGGEIRVLESLLYQNFAPTKHGVYFLDGSPAFKTAPRLKLLDFTTHAIRTIATVPGPVGDEISVSPDEQWMLFFKTDRQGSELMLVENFH
jgi:Tol biopolymer transport system component/DNA-binding winged helix-turn-helix (wHTH) protein